MFLVLLIFAVTLLYYFMQEKFSYWNQRHIPGPTPLPLVGNMGPNVIGKKSMGEICTDIYRNYETYPFVGIYKAGLPCLLVRDIDFIKNILVQDFKHFPDNEAFMDKDADPLIGRNPFLMRGEEWKKGRIQMSPGLTSGKLKGFFSMVDQVSQRMVNYIMKKIERSSTGLEAKELCSMFTLDNVALCTIGVEAKSFDEIGTEIEDVIRRFILPSNWKLVALLLIPALANFISVKFVPKDVDERILALVKTTIKYRKERGIERNDFLNAMIEHLKTNQDYTELDAAGHVCSFIGDGYDTSSSVMGFLLFELAVHPKIQEKLREEINTVIERNDKQFTYESLQEMSYLNACLNESMRKNAPILNFARICAESYTYTSTDPEYKIMSVTVEPGIPVIIPVQALHLDPKYFYSPHQFIPERFLSKTDFPKHAFLPFGEGPRICVGKRFGLLQVKIGIVHLVKHFKITLNPRTKLPISLDPWHFTSKAKEGKWLDFYKI